MRRGSGPRFDPEHRRRPKLPGGRKGDVDHLRRLSLIRYLYGRGLDQFEQPAPLGAFALLPLHDAVEMFLQLAAEVTGAPVQRKEEFLGYWKALANAVPPISLPLYHAMGRLNQARVTLKHHGLFPDEKDLRALVSSVDEFLNASCKLIFNVALERVSLVNLIRHDRVRERLCTSRAGRCSRRI